MNTILNSRPESAPKVSGYPAPGGWAGTTTATRTQKDQFHEYGMVVNHVGHDDHDDGLVHGHEWAAAK